MHTSLGKCKESIKTVSQEFELQLIDDELAIVRCKQTCVVRSVTVFGCIHQVQYEFLLMLSHHRGSAANSAVPAHSFSQSSSRPTCEWAQCHLSYVTCTTWRPTHTMQNLPS